MLDRSKQTSKITHARVHCSHARSGSLKLRTQTSVARSRISSQIFLAFYSGWIFMYLQDFQVAMNILGFLQCHWKFKIPSYMCDVHSIIDNIYTMAKCTQMQCKSTNNVSRNLNFHPLSGWTKQQSLCKKDVINKKPGKLIIPGTCLK